MAGYGIIDPVQSPLNVGLRQARRCRLRQPTQKSPRRRQHRTLSRLISARRLYLSRVRRLHLFCRFTPGSQRPPRKQQCTICTRHCHCSKSHLFHFVAPPNSSTACPQFALDRVVVYLEVLGKLIAAQMFADLCVALLQI